MANVYDKGDLVRCSASFTTSAGAAVDPTVITFKFKTPGGTTTTYTYGVDAELVKDSVGNYHVDVSATASGTWFYRFEGTGDAQAADEASILIEKSEF